MYAVIVDNHQTGESILVNGTIYDDEETARALANHVNQSNPGHISAWIKDWQLFDKGILEDNFSSIITTNLANSGE